MTNEPARRLAYFGPPALLLAVALVQIGLARVQGEITPWSGGGFGMFSSVDKLVNRYLIVYAIAAGGERPFAPPAHAPGAAELIVRAKAFPSASHLREVARLAARTSDRPADAFRVEVWKRRFDPATRRATRVKLRELVLETGR